MLEGCKRERRKEEASGCIAVCSRSPVSLAQDPSLLTAGLVRPALLWAPPQLLASSLTGRSSKEETRGKKDEAQEGASRLF